MIRRIVGVLASISVAGAFLAPIAPFSVSAAAVRPVRSLGNSAAPSLLFGVNAHFMWHGSSRTQQELSWMKAAGITTARFDLTWSDLEPSRGTFDPATVSKLDAVLAAMAAEGVQPIITVMSTSGWANNNAGRWVPPTNMQDYGDALRFLAARYVGRSPRVVWEIWNEPNDPSFWQPSPNATQYTAMLEAAYTSIKSVDPGATVLGGSILHNDLRYLDRMYAAGARGFFDGLSLHPYTVGGVGPADRDIAHNGYFSFTLAVEQMEEEMARYGQPNEPIWITEMGWPTSVVSDSTRATYLQQAVGLVRTWPYVRAVCPYVLDQTDDSSFGLVTSIGIPTASWSTYAAEATLSSTSAAASTTRAAARTPRTE